MTLHSEASGSTASTPSEDLGRLLSEGRRSARLGFSLLAVGTLLVTLVLSFHGSLFLFVVGAIFLLGGIGTTIATYTSPTFSFYSGGIVTSRFGHTERCLWVEVERLSLTEMNYFASGLQYDKENCAVLTRYDGKGFVLRGITRGFAEALLQTIYPPLLEKARATIAGGQVADFGALSLALDGVWQGDHLTPWSNVEGVSVELGDTVVLKRRGLWSIRVKATKVANLPNFMILVNEHMQLPLGV